MAHKEGQVIVWEWETNDTGIFVPYDEMSSNLIEMKFSSGILSVDLSQLGASYSAWTIDLSTMQQRSSYFGRQRNIRRKRYPNNSLIAYGIVWEFISDLDWQQFDVKTSAIIEDNHNNGYTCLDINQPNSLPITLDFSSMTVQYHQNMSLKRIRRRTVHVPYIRGSVSPIQRLTVRQQAQFKQAKSGAAVTHPVLKQFCKACDSVEEDEECSICLCELRGHPEVSGATGGDELVVELNNCHHRFHECCLGQCYDNGNKDGSIQCPICKSIHGTKIGNQPPGTMTTQRMSAAIPGYPGCGCIQITYNISEGVQGQGHPNPGQPYYAYGFPRIAFLPDNAKGNKVLHLLKEAWKRKLIFTVGTSVTNGSQNAVVWNDIHHKTEGFSNISGHGYPDPNYLDNVLGELKVHGVE